MASETRWPEFARRASQAGAASMLSLQLYVEGDNLGALNLYSRTPNAFDDESEQVGLLFASHAAVAYAGVRKEAQLARAVDSRDLIGQAKRHPDGALQDQPGARVPGADPRQPEQQPETPRHRHRTRPPRHRSWHPSTADPQLIARNPLGRDVQRRIRNGATTRHVQDCPNEDR
jgi:hypothetical protein